MNGDTTVDTAVPLLKSRAYTDKAIPQFPMELVLASTGAFQIIPVFRSVMLWPNMFPHLRTIRYIGVAEPELLTARVAAISLSKMVTARNTVTILNVKKKDFGVIPEIITIEKFKE